MSSAPAPDLFTMARGEAAFGPGETEATVGATRRASLGRALAFVLLLAASLSASVCIPMACRGPDWVEGGAPHAAVP